MNLQCDSSNFILYTQPHKIGYLKLDIKLLKFFRGWCLLPDIELIVETWQFYSAKYRQNATMLQNFYETVYI